MPGQILEYHLNNTVSFAQKPYIYATESRYWPRNEPFGIGVSPSHKTFMSRADPVYVPYSRPCGRLDRLLLALRVIT